MDLSDNPNMVNRSKSAVLCRFRMRKGGRWSNTISVSAKQWVCEYKRKRHKIGKMYKNTEPTVSQENIKSLGDFIRFTNEGIPTRAEQLKRVGHCKFSEWFRTANCMRQAISLKPPAVHRVPLSKAKWWVPSSPIVPPQSSARESPYPSRTARSFWTVLRSYLPLCSVLLM